MNEVLVGVFDSFAQAERARAALIAAGFEREALRIAGRSSLAGNVSFDADFDAHPNDSIGEQIAKIFTSLIGGTARGAQDVQRLTHEYPEAARRGKAVLFVGARSADQRRRAEASLREHGAIDIDEHAEAWRAAGADERAERPIGQSGPRR